MKMKQHLLGISALLIFSLLMGGCAIAPAANDNGELPPVDSGTVSGAPQDTESTAEAASVSSDPGEVLQYPYAGGITMWVGSTEAMVNGVPTQMPGAPFVENGIFYFPVQFVAETLGWDYTYEDGEITISTLHETCRYENGAFVDYEQQLYTSKYYVGAAKATIDGVDCVFNNSYELFQTGEKQYGDMDDTYVPMIRDGIVFLPFNICNATTEANSFSFFYGQQHPDLNCVILNGNGKEDGIGGFYVFDIYDELPQSLRSNMQDLGVVGDSRDAYDVVEYGANGLYVHVLRLQKGAENLDGLDGLISSVYTTNPEIPTPRGLCCGESEQRILETYDGSFSQQHYAYALENGILASFGFFSYYDGGTAGGFNYVRTW